MSADMSAVLCSRYPALYGAMFTFECFGGWGGILDALSETLVWHAEIGRRPAPQAQQVKEKYGTLRWYHGFDERDDGAISLAEEISSRTCERTGRPGQLGCRGGWWATRAPGLEPRLEYRFSDDVPELGVTAENVRRMRAAFDGELDVPSGWLDLVDGMLRQLARQPFVLRAEPSGSMSIVVRRHAPELAMPVRVSRIWRGGTGDLRVDYVGGRAYGQGVVACAVAMARRVDPENGNLGFASV